MEKKSKALNIQGSVIPQLWTSTALDVTRQGSSYAPDKKCISSLSVAGAWLSKGYKRSLKNLACSLIWPVV
jgi:hypothetical protein